MPLQDQVGAHAAPCKVLDALIALGAVGVGVKVAAVLVAHVLEELDQED